MVMSIFSLAASSNTNKQRLTPASGSVHDADLVEVVADNHAYCEVSWAPLSHRRLPADTFTADSLQEGGCVLYSPGKVVAAGGVPAVTLEIEISSQGDEVVLCHPAPTQVKSSCRISSSDVALADGIEKEQLIFALERRVGEAKQHEKRSLSTQSARIAVAREIGRLEKAAVLQQCTNAISEAPSACTLDSFLEISPGALTKRSYNLVVCALS